jgi:hypothetical protein
MIVKAQLINGLGLALEASEVTVMDEDDEFAEAPAWFLTVACFQFVFIFGVVEN